MKHGLVFFASMCALAGCSKGGEAPTPSGQPIASPSASATPSPAPTTAPTPSPSPATGSASMDQLAGSWQFEMDGKPNAGSSFDLKPDGTWSMTMTQGTETHKATGTAELKDGKLVLTMKESDGKPNPEPDKTESMTISPDGKKMVDSKGTTSLVRK